MVQITPVKLPTSSRSLWFDANGKDARKGDRVIVLTARGNEFGVVSDDSFEATQEQLDALKSPLKPVRRIATEEDIAKAERLKQLGRDAMPAFRQIVEEEGLEMRPISAEYLFDGDKAVFYFEAEDRVDFRDLVRKLASKFHVRVDMRQIGVRDEARMVGGLGHCGQELCCKRLGGEFCPVSIRMAKEQDLSLNPQKISGICGRLMCCLRYEYDAYKDFKTRAPKVGAAVSTPDGKGKVVSLDVPREIVTIQAGEDKKVKVPLGDMEKSDDQAARPDTVGEEAWERANTNEDLAVFGNTTFLTSQFTADDKLGDAKAIHRDNPSRKQSKQKGSSGSGSQRSSRGEKAAVNASAEPTRKPRRRSTKLAAGATPDAASIEQRTTKQEAQSNAQAESAKKASAAKPARDGAQKDERPARRRRVRSRSNNADKQANPAVQDASTKNTQAQNGQQAASEKAPRRRSRRGQAPDQKIAPVSTGQGASDQAQAKPALRPGHRSSSLRQHGDEANPKTNAEQRNENAHDANNRAKKQQSASGSEKEAGTRPPRRRRRRSSGSNANQSQNQNPSSSSEKSE